MIKNNDTDKKKKRTKGNAAEENQNSVRGKH